MGAEVRFGSKSDLRPLTVLPALLPKAEIDRRLSHARLVPEAGILDFAAGIESLSDELGPWAKLVCKRRRQNRSNIN